MPALSFLRLGPLMSILRGRFVNLGSKCIRQCLIVPKSVWISAQFSWLSVTWTLIIDPPVDCSVIVWPDVYTCTFFLFDFFKNPVMSICLFNGFFPAVPGCNSLIHLIHFLSIKESYNSLVWLTALYSSTDLHGGQSYTVVVYVP